MNVVVVEDEPPAARRLIELLGEVAPAARVVARLASVAELVRWLADHHPPDLILADIELQDGRVFDAFRSADPTAPIIFTTAYDQFLLDAFHSHGIAYLLKPIRADALAGALAKYDSLRRAFAASPRLPALPDVAAPEYRRHFTVSAARRVHVVALERVALIRLGLAGIAVIDVDGAAATVTGSATLADLERSLPPPQFFRINRREIVRLAAIVQLEPRRDRVVLTLRGVPEPVTVAVHRSAAFRSWIGLSG